MSYGQELSEIRRIGESELTVEWRIPFFLSLNRRMGHNYHSREFEFCDEKWWLSVHPGKSSGFVELSLWRRVPKPKTFLVSAGLRGPTGVENERQPEKESSCREFRIYHWDKFCLRKKLKKDGSRLMPMPDDALTITCSIKTADATAEVLSPPHLPKKGDAEKKKPLPSVAESQSPNKQEPSADVLVIYNYKELEDATQNFSDKPLQAGGCKIGEGGFGSVYRAIVKGNVLAVKRLKDPVDTQFITELKTLTNYKHENLVPLLGCSLGPKCCILYQYMPNGSLEDRLACEGRSKPLSWQTRISIAHGSALGINHLHTFCEEPVVHRDIKSANILLDQNLVPKVGDFGLVRAGGNSGSTTMAVTEILCGTRGYMPREAHLGDVSVKWDTYSFGVVLLELLTGLPPYDQNWEHKFLILHVENCKDILRMLDSKAKWNKKAATELYRITQTCLADSKRSRPYVSEILEDLRKLSVLS